MVTYKLLIENVRNKLRHLGIPQRELPKIINAYLPIRDRIDEGRVGEVQCNRWLANQHHRQTIARGDIVLALFQYCYFPLNEHRIEPSEQRTHPSGVVFGDPQSIRGCDNNEGLRVPEQTSSERTQPDQCDHLDIQR